MVFLLKKPVLFFLCFTLTLLSCNEKDKIAIENSASAFDINQGEASIKQSNQNFMKAFKALDSETVSNSYTTDAKAMVANIPTIEGRNNIKHFISEEMNKGIRDIDLHTIKIWGDSNMLAEEGTYKSLDSLGKKLDKGKYIVLWKIEAGNWKMYRDIWTSDEPGTLMLPEKKSVSKK
ncbi:MAG: hypothetical protein Q8891_01705 [Bacteroidota bacterium]|nr:hypothetical protein [Bacteroidota bacterium]